jgi:hypothetical protein
VPSIAIPKTTEVIVIETPKQHVTPQFATDSKVWRREHAIVDNFRPPAPVHGKAPIAATIGGQSLEF